MAPGNFVDRFCSMDDHPERGRLRVMRFSSGPHRQLADRLAGDPRLLAQQGLVRCCVIPCRTESAVQELVWRGELLHKARVYFGKPIRWWTLHSSAPNGECSC